MSERPQHHARTPNGRFALRVGAAALAAAACLALLADGVALLVEHPERVSGAHEAAASQAIVLPERGAAPAARETPGPSDRSERDEPQAGEAELVAVATVLVESGVEQESFAAALAALAVELASANL